MSIQQPNGYASFVENKDPGLSIEPWIRQSLERIGALSNREREVLRLLGIGMENRAAAAALGIAERTVKQHITRILIKLGCTSRLQAGLVAFAAWLLSDADSLDRARRA